MKPTLWWRVELSLAGLVVETSPVDGPARPDGQVFYVQAHTEAEAARVARNAYERARVSRQRKAYQAAGKCRCGRNRENRLFKQCLTCRTRNLNHLKKLRAEGPRDEEARVAAMQGRQRDRRQELRLEVLLLVREQWRQSPNVAAFGAWLAKEITSAIAKESSVEATEEQLEAAVLEIARQIESRRKGAA